MYRAPKRAATEAMLAMAPRSPSSPKSPQARRVRATRSSVPPPRRPLETQTSVPGKPLEPGKPQIKPVSSLFFDQFAELIGSARPRVVEADEPPAV